MKANLNKLKRLIVKASFHAGEGHLGSDFSILDILWVLYDKVLAINPKRPDDPRRDRFFLSKGQASLALYAVLAEKGFFSGEWLKKYCDFESRLGGHPDRNKVPGAEASTGSLGHGFPMAVGNALGLKIKHFPSRVFVLIGDGEANEGAVWESALLAAHHKLDNLSLILDYNHSTDRALRLGDLRTKFEAFGWTSVSVDGHDHKAIEKALRTKHLGKPLAVIAETIKGRGSKIMENNPAWHHKAPNREELEIILKELSPS
ncbi:MAG: transketolase [Candidatus Taylorbacteria bacterium]|nr:transketolase [Candidatus Taylorbacteria bacterium]